MTHDLFLALLGFAFVSSITPGPNNLMLMASGANFGFRRTVPHMLGIACGFMVMVVLVGTGLMQVFDAWPPVRTILTVLSVAYLAWLAWKIAHAAAPGSGGQESARPFSFFQAALFQWVNPKAWTMTLTAITLYAPGREWAPVVLVALAFGAVNLPSVSVWAFMGQRLRLWLTSPRRLRAFNWTMAALLLATLYPVLYPAA
ncbi:LysE family translocator [Rhodalgimonas zhirmunskyi]|uniref:LysE family translocator n=1 Tax=Rhodalgimonas zhirmunskyi TaxID=2964767 RepID=A0AAJ1U6S5_9RHOB|nr:LysE family translocator [Rhodoalgimonas zhirmunskyi]MDQ2094516.1 LysE family translocator [Rhodoalgimonas zhirmunskyi]